MTEMRLLLFTVVSVSIQFHVLMCDLAFQAMFFSSVSTSRVEFNVSITVSFATVDQPVSNHAR